MLAYPDFHYVTRKVTTAKVEMLRRMTSSESAPPNTDVILMRLARHFQARSLEHAVRTASDCRNEYDDVFDDVAWLQKHLPHLIKLDPLSPHAVPIQHNNELRDLLHQTELGKDISRRATGLTKGAPRFTSARKRGAISEKVLARLDCIVARD